jgi:uncharacterized damage-inducible protein DinB
MTISETFLPEYDQEMASSRKFIERVPDDKLTWKPHEKSMTLGRLASHMAEMAVWAEHSVNLDRLVLGPEMRPFNAASRAELLETFDKNVPIARAGIERTSDEQFAKIWELEYQGQVMISMPRIAVLRGVVMNHMIHHRGQLSVYFRLNDIPVPGVYGPSGDERPGSF